MYHNRWIGKVFCYSGTYHFLVYLWYIQYPCTTAQIYKSLEFSTNFTVLSLVLRCITYVDLLPLVLMDTVTWQMKKLANYDCMLCTQNIMPTIFGINFILSIVSMIKITMRAVFYVGKTFEKRVKFNNTLVENCKNKNYFHSSYEKFRCELSPLAKRKWLQLSLLATR